jgi:LysR family transcriptional activator of nhaA
MEWLNYHHLLYFWAVGRHGSITKASKELNLAQPTISGQIRTLEDTLGEKLFAKSGRNLVLTDAGQMVYRYADEIFSLGREMMDTLKGRPTGKPLKLRVGITDVMPKLISHRLLEPALQLNEEVQLVCHEDKTERLLANLAIHGLDLVLADAPLDASTRVRAFNHLLGECGVSFFATQDMRDAHRRRFPHSLDGAPMLLPTANTLLRRALDQWFAKNSIYPNIIAEFEDSALLKVFGEYGAGIFPAPTIVDKEICDTYGVRVVGRTDEVRERFYAITIERRIKHPAARAISEFAREQLFG